ncbi:MAG TPA: ATP-binding cassette domain-containing protein [Thermoplasmata archaeon]|nr:ATP-binding cassette domain-containing protein [Thermoplasmata archaeon]
MQGAVVSAPDPAVHPNAVITVSDLRMVYPGPNAEASPTVALDGVGFYVGRGEIFGFLGPNGAGKTTTISILTTLLKPTSGHATVEGLDVAVRPDEVRRMLGLVFQKSTADEELTGRENMMLQAGLYGQSGPAVSARITELLARMDLATVGDRFVKTYSGGMRRRLELAVGMVHGPKLLFLDEPTLGLDPQGRAGFWSYIRSLRENEGMTVFMTTHYLDEADQLCDRIAVIDHGKIIALGTPKQLKDGVGGDSLEVTVAPGSPDLAPLVQKMPGVKAVTRRDDTYRVKCLSGEQLVPKVVLTAEQAGITVRGVTVVKPTLDEVFLDLTGRAYREEGETPKPEAAAPPTPTAGEGERP